MDILVKLGCFFTIGCLFWLFVFILIFAKYAQGG
jgi:hypothetical protein